LQIDPAEVGQHGGVVRAFGQGLQKVDLGCVEVPRPKERDPEIRFGPGQRGVEGQRTREGERSSLRAIGIGGRQAEVVVRLGRVRLVARQPLEDFLGARPVASVEPGDALGKKLIAGG